MKTLCSLCSLLLILGLLGCATSKPPAQTAADIQALAYTAASVGATVALEEKPGSRALFQAAYELLDDQVATKSISAQQLRFILSELPVKELKSPTARLVIDNAIYLYHTTVGSEINLAEQPYVLAAATGLRDGLKAALQR